MGCWKVGSFASLVLCVALGLTVATARPAVADELSEAYERASFIENGMGNRYYLNRLPLPQWIDEESFWYRQETAEGHRYIKVRARDGAKRAPFNHERLARALQQATQKKVTADSLPLRALDLSDDKKASFVAFDKAWEFSSRNELEETGPADSNAGAVTAPDGAKSAFVRDFNIWIRDTETGEERQLTTDGEAYYAYGLGPDANREFGVGAEVLWSPDSTKILTIQTDDRQIKPLAVMQFVPVPGEVRPTLFEKRTALPGDTNVPMYRLTIIDVETGQQTAVRYQDIPAVRMNDTPINGNRVWWRADSSEVYFVDIERGEQRVHVVAANAETGSARVLFSEESNTFIDLSQNVYLPTTLAHLKKQNQLIWYSQRSGWAHFYLYDLNTGEMIRTLTQGAWVVRDLLNVDEEDQTALISLAGRTPDKNPYYQEVALVDLTDGSLTIVSASDGDNNVVSADDMDSFAERFIYNATRPISGASPDGTYFIESQLQMDRPTRTVLKRRDGSEVAVLELGEISGLPEGMQFPQPISVISADGETAIYGILCRPSNFSPDKSYPIVNHIYGGPQVFYVPSSFTGPALQCQAIAELGFIGVVMDGRGTPGRSKAFHDASYGAMETASNLADHVAGIRELATRYPYIDDERVGIFGFSGGGYMTARALFDYADFFDVGVAGAGNHDQRLFWHGWGERYQGLLDGDNYVEQANVSVASNLKGDLLLIHGLLDYGVHPAGMFQLAMALNRANKNYDLVVMPGTAHSMTGYGLRRQWDYFVEHLAGQTPPDPMPLVANSESFQAIIAKVLVGEPLDTEQAED